MMEHNNAHAVVSQGEEMKSSGESKTGDIPDVSSVSDSKSMKKSVTGSDDMEEDETKYNRMMTKRTLCKIYLKEKKVNAISSMIKAGSDNDNNISYLLSLPPLFKVDLLF
ncbi:unnamed protein product [Brugia timori]|uniref:Uncharacterized protein n=1 Tax=Brugia timori TaxID=42155 RepID=A0A3P7WQE7_9BILA|nr:unnamed protein product [Brugia timori]